MTRLVLANAIYFKGKWEKQFDENATTRADFRVSPGETVRVPMMSRKGDFNYTENGRLQVLELPYQGNELSMVVLLPGKVDGISRMEASLNPKSLDALLGSLETRKVTVYFPRFKTTSSFNLKDTLESMGMPDAFDPARADFSGIDGHKSLFLSAAIHKAFVEVNEEGTEAAAATGMIVVTTSVPLEPLVFRADHPFLFLIRHNPSGSILFLGRVFDPSQE